jgi:hypothetical protein
MNNKNQWWKFKMGDEAKTAPGITFLAALFVLLPVLIGTTETLSVKIFFWAAGLALIGKGIRDLTRGARFL